MSTLSKSPRTFLSADFSIKSWEQIKPYYDELNSRNIASVDELRKWFQDRSELESVLSEDMGWRYIRMTGDTANKEFVEAFNYFVSEIQPHVAPYSNALDKKAFESPFLKELTAAGFDIVKRNIEKDIKIFRDENIPLYTEIDQESQKFGQISGAMTAEMEGKELTLQQASDYMLREDRAIREEAYRKIQSRRAQDKTSLDDLFTRLASLRHNVSVNAGYANFRDYMFTAMGRFEYGPKDCFTFHEAVQKEVVPLLNSFAKERKDALKLEALRPWDLSYNYFGKNPLKPFDGGEDLLNKTIQCFYKIDTYLGDCLTTMKEMGHLDLVSRKGKAPGGYNYPLDETGVPFIFMNATSSLRDLVTMVHEGGHALHSFLTRDLELNVFKHPPSEVAELASMSMELITMEHWDLFFTNKKDLMRARREHLEGIIQTLPWVATVDKFQHWLYENNGHSLEQRKKAWLEISGAFANSVTDWSGLEEYKAYGWQKQLHIFEVPFYYIEYAIAQLGAVAVWKNYKENPKKGYEQYIAALKLGYTQPIREIYKTAGVKFDFSAEYIRELMQFVKKEIDKLTLN